MSAILYTYAACTYEIEPPAVVRPEIVLLFAILERAKRDYQLCPREQWKDTRIAWQMNNGGDRFVNLAKEAYYWACSRSIKEFSYRWIRDFVPELPADGFAFLSGQKVRRRPYSNGLNSRRIRR